MTNCLKEKRIVVCVTGSVAAIETPKLVRELRRNGAEVHCVMSENAKKIIHPYVLQWASDNNVITEITGNIEHVKLCGDVPDKAHLLIVAPSTANTIGKMANAVDDTTVTTFISTAFGSGIPIAVVPAMHISMYNHPILLENIKKLRKYGVDFIEPRIEEKKAKFPKVESVVDYVLCKLSEKDFSGKKVVVTAGPTSEDIDPVRCITNRSSGKTGVWIAEEAHRRGAEVTLIRGKTSVEPRFIFEDIMVDSAEEMLDAVRKNIKADIIIHTAAVSDYTVDKNSKKIDSKNPMNLKLKQTTKIIDQIKKLNKNIFLVGFKAECEVSDKQLVDRALEKIVKSNADIIAANDVCRKDQGFGSDSNELILVNGKKETKKINGHKREIANILLDEIINAPNTLKIPKNKK